MTREKSNSRNAGFFKDQTILHSRTGSYEKCLRSSRAIKQARFKPRAREKLSESENERVVRAYFEAYNRHEQESIFDDWSDDFEVVTPMLRKLDYDGFREEMLHERSAFSDAQMTIRNLISKGDVVAVETDWKGTQTGEYLGRSPTNVKYKAPGAWIFELENGMITRIRYYFNPTLYS